MLSTHVDKSISAPVQQQSSDPVISNLTTMHLYPRPYPHSTMPLTDFSSTHRHILGGLFDRFGCLQGQCVGLQSRLLLHRCQRENCTWAQLTHPCVCVCTFVCAFADLSCRCSSTDISCAEFNLPAICLFSSFERENNNSTVRSFTTIYRIGIRTQSLQLVHCWRTEKQTDLI